MSCEAVKPDERFEHLAQRHPCLGRAPNRGRLHLPVSPYCNIKCRFCTRSFNETEHRPGVTRSVLPLDETVEIVNKAVELCPELSVIGIAGPGDSLASEHALVCLSRLNKEQPELIGCMSTNGLMLPESIDAIVEAGISTVTVTVNAVNPELLAQIVEKVILDGKTYGGTEGSEILISRQLQGIEKLAERDVFIKINMVLIPEINGNHAGEVARMTSGLGASIINIIPLIPQGDFIHMPPPTCRELNIAREEAERYLPVFRHCQHCRADACGILGKADISSRLYENLSCENTFSHG